MTWNYTILCLYFVRLFMVWETHSKWQQQQRYSFLPIQYHGGKSDMTLSSSLAFIVAAHLRLDRCFKRIPASYKCRFCEKDFLQRASYEIHEAFRHQNGRCPSFRVNMWYSLVITVQNSKNWVYIPGVQRKLSFDILSIMETTWNEKKFTMHYGR